MNSNTLNETGRGRGLWGGGGDHAKKCESSQAWVQWSILSLQKRKVICCQFSWNCTVYGSCRFWLLGTKGELDFSGKLLKAKLMKTWVCCKSTQLMPDNGKAQSKFFEWKQNFLKCDQNARASTWKRWCAKFCRTQLEHARTGSMHNLKLVDRQWQLVSVKLNCQRCWFPLVNQELVHIDVHVVADSLICVEIRRYNCINLIYWKFKY